MNQLLEPTISQKIWLEISRGKSKFRSRPVHQGRFLIGAGSTCHLQLGGDQIPMLHSVIETSDEGLTIEAIVSQPALFINGQHRRSASLFEGDVVEIGPFEFRVHAQAESMHQVDDAAGIETEVDHDFEDDISGLSAGQLVARISELEGMAEEFDEERERGATSLLAAIRKAGSEANETQLPDTRYDEVVRTLSMLSDQVVSQAQQFAEREQAWQQALFSMQDTQQRIITQLAQLTQAALHETPAVSTRASA
jgi:hypothetical protein